METIGRMEYYLWSSFTIPCSVSIVVVFFSSCGVQEGMDVTAGERGIGGRIACMWFSFTV